MTASGTTSFAVDPQNPWLGLASFTEETRTFFHGRDDEVAELARQVRRELLTVLFGQSGLGKTSLLRAGLVPQLSAEGYRPLYIRLDYNRDALPPAEQIKQEIARASADGQWTGLSSAAAGESLWEFFHHRGSLLRDAAGATLVPMLIFDQFEEVFTLAQSDEAGRERARSFLRELADLVENRPPADFEVRMERDEGVAERFDFSRADYRILIALREDYLPHLEGLKNLMPSITQNRLRLARMTGAQALQVVLGPGRDIVREDVARQIVLFVSGASGFPDAQVETSLLSLVCRELNEARKAHGKPEISTDLLAGTRDTILAEFYERALAGQPAGVRRYLEDSLLTDAGFRENVAEERVRKAFAEIGAPPDCLEILIGRRLLRIEERLDVRRVELTHDVLCSVVKGSRDTRREREAKNAAEEQLAATRAEEVAAKRALRRARGVAFGFGALALFAIGSAIFGYISLRRSRAAEMQVRAAAEAARVAEAKRDDDIALRLIRQAEAQADRFEAARAETERNRQIADGARRQAARLAQFMGLYADAVAQPNTPEGRLHRGAALDESAKIIDSPSGDTKIQRDLHIVHNWIASELKRLDPPAPPGPK
jgi:hypothetical protein